MSEDITSVMDDVHIRLDKAGMTGEQKWQALRAIYQAVFDNPDASVNGRIRAIRAETSRQIKAFLEGESDDQT
jgi:hypothetical protein